jgi:DNA-binding NarL/FixJ family response regulator
MYDMQGTYGAKAVAQERRTGKNGRKEAESMAQTEDKPAATLTRREVQVLDLIGRGLTSSEAAEMLFLSKRTVDYHLSKIYEKLNVSNRVQALHEAMRLKAEGLLTSQPS